MNSNEKDQMLKLLRESLIEKDEEVINTQRINEDILAQPQDDLVFMLAEKMSSEGGKFVYCENEAALFTKLSNLIQYRGWENIRAYSKNLETYLSVHNIATTVSDAQQEVGVSLCQGIVAPTGAMIITSVQGAGRNLKHFPPVMIVIATTAQVFHSYKQVVSLLPQTPPQWIISIKSGKLIEEEVKELYLFLVEE